MKRNWEKIFVSPNTTIKEAMRIINDGALRIALVVDGKKKLLGTIADGDIRRGLIGRIRLSDPVSRVMNSSPHVARQNSSQDDRLGTMRKYHLLQIPVLDKFGRVVGLDAIDESLEHPRRDNWILLMAGGYGTRLRPLTDDCPKPMLRVGGKPILENILEGFLAAGYHRFYLSVHYMQDKIRAYFGDGGRWNATIQYVEEDRPLGTAGALGLLPTVDGEPLIVMNADLLTRLNFIDLLNHHQRNKADITMCIREYDFQVPFGVVHTKGDNVIKIVEKPMYMHYVNAGIYVISPAVVKAAKRRKRLDMPELIESVIQRRGKVVKYAVHEYWLDVGRMDDFERAQIEFKPA